MGSPQNFGQFARALRELARVPAMTATAAAAKIQTDMRKHFRAGEDPYGRAYEPLTGSSIRRGRRPPPLRKYARYANAAPQQGAGIAMTNTHPQAGFHQTGTRVMARRIVIPDGSLPAKWRQILEREFKKAVRAKVGGK